MTELGGGGGTSCSSVLTELLQSDSKSIVGAGNFGLGAQEVIYKFIKFIICLLRWLFLI